MTLSWFFEALTREPLPRRFARELGPVAGLLRPVDLPPVWVLGQKKAGTSLAANFISHGLYGRDAAIDLPVRRWLQRALLPMLFRRDARLAVAAIARVQRERVVKEPNFCYRVRELAEVLDGRATIVYVTRDRAQHLRSVLDRVLERRADRLHVRSDLNFVWRAYVGDLGPGAAVDDNALGALVGALATHFDATERTCLDVLARMRDPALIVRYEDLLANGGTPALRSALEVRWPQFDWARARRTLAVQHQPRGARLVDTRFIRTLLGAPARETLRGPDVPELP